MWGTPWMGVSQNKKICGGWGEMWHYGYSCGIVWTSVVRNGYRLLRPMVSTGACEPLQQQQLLLTVRSGTSAMGQPCQDLIMPRHMGDPRVPSDSPV